MFATIMLLIFLRSIENSFLSIFFQISSGLFYNNRNAKLKRWRKHDHSQYEQLINYLYTQRQYIIVAVQAYAAHEAGGKLESFEYELGSLNQTK